MTPLCFFSLLYAAITDCRRREIPDAAVFLLLCGGIGNAVIRQQSLFAACCGGIVLGGLMLLCAWDGGIGGGDIKLTAALGVAFGFWTAVSAIVLALVMMIAFAAVGRRKALPYAPFLLCSVSFILLIGG